MPTILNLGAGVQSTTLFLWAHDGRFEVDAAYFADTLAEPAPVYRHLDWLRALGRPAIRTVTAGDLGRHFVAGGARSVRAASVPAYFVDRRDSDRSRPHTSINERRCSNEYKARPIRTAVAREILGVRPGKRISRKSGRTVDALYGISTDEAARADRIVRSCRPHHWWRPRFPLLEAGWARRDCEAFLRGRVPHPVPRSSCVFCPYRTDAEWAWLRSEDPEGFRRAAQLDTELRQTPNAANSGDRGDLFLHRSCVPLPLVEFEDADTPTLDLLAVTDCSGYCAT